jgi:hypothetical protein
MMILLRMMNFVLKMQMIWMMRLKLNFFLFSLESLIHDSSSQKKIIERLKNKISEFELNVQSYESKLQNLKKNFVKCT